MHNVSYLYHFCTIHVMCICINLPFKLSYLDQTSCLFIFMSVYQLDLCRICVPYVHHVYHISYFCTISVPYCVYHVHMCTYKFYTFFASRTLCLFIFMLLYCTVCKCVPCAQHVPCQLFLYCLCIRVCMSCAYVYINILNFFVRSDIMPVCVSFAHVLCTLLSLPCGYPISIHFLK